MATSPPVPRVWTAGRPLTPTVSTAPTMPARPERTQASRPRRSARTNATPSATRRPRLAVRVLARTGAVLQTVLCVVLLTLSVLPLAGARGLVVTSGSMEPTIGVGALAIVTHVDTDEVVAGDVLTYHGYGQDRLTTHRVVQVISLDSGLHFQTQGDANEKPDVNLAPARGVVGRVAFSLPHAGRILTLMMQRWVLLGLVLLAALPPLVGEVRNVWRRLVHVRRRSPVLGPTTLLTVGLALLVGAGGLAASRAVMTDTVAITDNTFATTSDFTAS